MKKHISLFSGAGGFDLASEAAGWTNVAHCEINPFCRQILNYYWPNAHSHADIKKTDFTPYRHTIDVLSAGFPCQPFSTAGKRKGAGDNRFLWPETRRAYNEIKPPWIVLENVAGLLSILSPNALSEVEAKEIELFGENENYQPNSTIERVHRRVVGQIVEQIKADGYILPTLEDGTPIILCIPACAKGAWHRRDRIWIIGHAEHNGLYGPENGGAEQKSPITPGQDQERQPERAACLPVQAAANGNRSGHRRHGHGKNERAPQQAQSQEDKRKRLRSKPKRSHSNDADFEIERREAIGTTWTGRHGSSPIYPQEHWIEAATSLCVVDDGLPDRLDGITLPKWREESIKAAGNSIYWPIALEIFKTIDKTDSQYQ